MINLSGKDVEKYDQLSKEISRISNELKNKKEMIESMVDALKIMEKELDDSIKDINALATATEKEVLRLESMTINDEPIVEIPVEQKTKKEEEKEKTTKNAKQSSFDDLVK